MRYIILLFIVLTHCAKAQTANEIITSSADKIRNLKNISYNIYVENPEQKITADVTIQRGVDLPVFEVGKIKVSALVIDHEGSKQIAFSYNGESFDFVDPRNGQMVMLDSPSYSKISRTKLFPYTMVALTPYWQKEPFGVLLTKLKEAQKMEDTVVFGVHCFKIRLSREIDSRITGKQTIHSLWFIGKEDFLVYGSQTSYDRQFLRIRGVNQDISADFFRLATNKEVKKITGLEPISEGLLAVGAKAPDWSLPSSSDKNISMKHLKGKVVLLDFWGTWCIPCIRTMPEIQSIHEEFKGKPVEVIGVSVEMEKGVDPLNFVKKRGYTYTILLDGHKITNDYKVREFPTVYLIDKKGNIIHAEHGGNRENFKEDLIKRINEALK